MEHRSHGFVRLRSLRGKPEGVEAAPFPCEPRGPAGWVADGAGHVGGGPFWNPRRTAAACETPTTVQRSTAKLAGDVDAGGSQAIKERGRETGTMASVVGRSAAAIGIRGFRRGSHRAY